VKRLAAAGLLLIAACSSQPPTVIDGSSPNAFERSAALARRDIPNADRLVFDRAIRTVGSRRMAERDADALARSTFNGMTAAQVVEDQKLRETLRRD
jgi:hypothetical protein